MALTMEGRARTFVIVATLIAMAALAGATSAVAAPTSFFGANLQPMIKLRVVHPSRWDSFVARMSADGLKTARMDAIWDWVERNPPNANGHTYVWNPPRSPIESMDQMVTLLASNGVRLSPVLSTPPRWARGGGSDLAPTRYPDFVAYAGAFAARYGTNGSFWAEHPNLPFLPVNDYEIWTEANSTNFWTHRPDPAEYLKVLAPVSRAIHDNDSRARVLASIGWQDFDNYLAQLYAAGAKGTIDGIGFHPYAPTAEAIVDLVRRLRRTLQNVGDPALPIYVTETGQPAALFTAPSITATNGGTVSDEARAATISLAGDALARSDCGVEDYLVYANVGSERPDAEDGYEALMGMYRVADGTPNATGAAIRDSAAALNAGPGAGLAVCGGGTTPSSNLLALTAGVVAGAPGCATAQVAYRGNPLEGAVVDLRTADGRGRQGRTDALGHSSLCLPACPAAGGVTLVARVRNIAASPDAPRSPVDFNCPDNGFGKQTEPATEPCSPRLKARLTRVMRHRSRLRVRLACAARARVALSVRVQRKGAHRRGLVLHRRIALRRTRTLVLRTSLRRGDRLVIAVAGNKRRGLVRQVRRVTATKALGAR